MKLFITITRQAIRALLSYKMRSVLTMTGIIIGICSIIVFISIGEGASQSVQEQILSLGTNMLIILPGSAKSEGVNSGYGTKPTLTIKDAEAIKRDCNSVNDVAYSLIHPAQVVAGKKNWGTTVYGTTPNYLSIRAWLLKAGVGMTTENLKFGSSVAIIGTSVYENLFGSGQEVIGRMIRINNCPFRIIGILESKGRTPDGRDQDDAIFIPFTTMERKLKGQILSRVVHYIIAAANLNKQVDLAKNELESLLRIRHKIVNSAEDDFTVRTLNEFVGIAKSTYSTMTLLLTSVASISLLIGGIGIMNVMLVSVTERTNEIGIRMAIGANENDILCQFLIEAVILSISGGILGTVLGAIISKLIAIIAGWVTIISIDSILLATIFSGAIGIFFGLHPALKASRLNPIVALKNE